MDEIKYLYNTFHELINKPVVDKKRLNRYRLPLRLHPLRFRYIRLTFVSRAWSIERAAVHLLLRLDNSSRRKILLALDKHRPDKDARIENYANVFGTVGCECHKGWVGFFSSLTFFSIIMKDTVFDGNWIGGWKFLFYLKS